MNDISSSIVRLSGTPEKAEERLHDQYDIMKTIESTVITMGQNITVAIERIDNIKESLDKKPSVDTVDKKISDAKIAVLMGVPAIIAICVGIYKLCKYFYLAVLSRFCCAPLLTPSCFLMKNSELPVNPGKIGTKSIHII